ncbi:AmmeMemoRadiSam system protein B, partial [Candidatus Parcubacteria bacterium]|nr:AmmeMemoRadiSam system protein B [Candidatus Parcubacteria bacterium]
KIILLGPNHEDRGSLGALTTDSGWETPFGVVQADSKAIFSLGDRGLVRVDNESLVAEQSVTALVAFIKYYLPEAQIVPIVLKSGFALEEAEILGEVLAELWDETSVLLASVDFSHYLTNFEAQRKDEVTLRAISDRNLPELFDLNSDYLDSPQAIGTLLVAVGLLGANEMEVLYHSNSGELSGNDFVPTTSYFVLTFRR